MSSSSSLAVSVLSAGVCSKCCKKVKEYPHFCDDGFRQCTKCLRKHQKGGKCKQCPKRPNYDRDRIYAWLNWRKHEDAIPLKEDPDTAKLIKGYLLLFCQNKLDVFGLLYELDKLDRWTQGTLLVFKHKLYLDGFLGDD